MVQVYRRERRGVDPRVLAALALCAALPVVLGIVLTGGSASPAPSAVQPAGGHWVYVPGRGVAVHVDGGAKRVDSTVQVGPASTGSPVVADRQRAYLVDDDQIVLFGSEAVTGKAPGAGVAEHPVPVETRDAAYLVYRTAGLVVRLGDSPVTVPVGGPLGAPVVTPDGLLWTYRVDSGQVCTVDEQLSCPHRVSAGRAGGLAVLDGRVGFVDVTAGTWQPLGGEKVELGVPLPANAAVGAASVGGRLAVVDPTEHRLLLIPERGSATSVPLEAGHVSAPVSTGDAVAVVNADTGKITSYDADGGRKDELTVPGGEVRLTPGADGRAYADATDGLQSVVMDRDGTLTPVRTTGETPKYEPQTPTPSTSLPPATVAATTTETVPPVPDTVTVQVTPTTTTSPPPAPTTTNPPAPPATTTTPGPGAPTLPSVDVLSAESTGAGQATIKIRVTGSDPVFCHVYFNSVERAATKCAGTMTVVANGLAPDTTYDIYVLGTNAAGTGVPGRRAVLQT